MILIALGLARLGILAHFLSHPVLSGFTSAAAILIIFSQLPSLLGIVPATCPDSSTWRLLAAVGSLNLSTLALGLLSIALLLVFGSPIERGLGRLGVSRARAGVIGKTAPLAVVCVTTILVTWFGLDGGPGVAVVGTLPKGFRPSGWPSRWSLPSCYPLRR